MIKYFKYLIVSICLTIYCFNPAFAQTVNKFDFERIEDNSFLIEEAYNQDPGVIQHISSFQYMKDHTWIYTFTDEWPVPGQKTSAFDNNSCFKQWVNRIGWYIAKLPLSGHIQRSIRLFPEVFTHIANRKFQKRAGCRGSGLPAKSPVQLPVIHKIATHYNLGLTFTPNAKQADGSASDITVFNYGLSMILLLNKNFNFMFEVAGNRTYTKVRTDYSKTGSFFINPGFRYAINFKSGLQIVPGLALPIGLGPSNGDIGIYGYLSFEHPIVETKKLKNRLLN